MKKVRRIVTGHTETGKATVISDQDVNCISIGPGKDFVSLASSDQTPIHPDHGEIESGLDWFPKPGGYRFFTWVVPPKSSKPVESLTPEETEKLLPGFVKYFEKDNPGMHTTDCVDCTYLISGSAILELDNHEQITINEGDTVVQNGTRHKWINESEIPAVFVTTSIGSERR